MMGLSPQLLRRFGFAFIGLGILLLLGAVGYLAAADSYVIYVAPARGERDAEPIQISGKYNTVAEVLAAAQVEVGVHDRSVPPLEAEPVADEPILVQRAMRVDVETDAGSRSYWSFQPSLGAFLQEQGIEIERTDRVFADNMQLPFAAVAKQPTPRQLYIGRYLLVSIRDGEREWVVRTEAQTVAEALQDANIRLYAADGVSPALGSWLTPDMEIVVRRSMPFTIQVDGKVIRTRSHQTNVLDLLADVGVGLVGKDYTVPGADEQLAPGDVIRVIRVTEEFQFEDEPIPYETRWQPSDQLDLDTTGVIQAGIPGVRRRRIRIRIENGQPVDQQPDAEWVAVEPVQQINGYGTRVVIRVVETPEGPLEYWRKVRMRVTSYTAESSGKAPGDPGFGITASGLPLSKGIVAVDRSVVPWRSHVYVPGYGVGLAADTGGGVIGRWIDLGYGDEDFEWWAGYTDVYYLTPVPPADQINYLLPSQLP